MKNKAFTLIEILICIAIFCLLSSLAAGQMSKAKCKTDADTGKPETEECRNIRIGSSIVDAVKPGCPACVCSCSVPTTQPVDNSGLIQVR